jgi:hypothetical protein
VRKRGKVVIDETGQQRKPPTNAKEKDELCPLTFLKRGKLYSASTSTCIILEFQKIKIFFVNYRCGAQT